MRVEYQVRKRVTIARLRVIEVVVLLTLCVSVSIAHGQQTQIVLDGNSTGRVFDGLGAASAGASSRLLIDYPEPQRSQILDYLFKPGYGAALQHLKVEIGADVNSTDGSEPSHMRTPADHDSTRGYEWWLMAEAHKRNPNIVLEILPWGAPGWVGEVALHAEDGRVCGGLYQDGEARLSLDIAYTGVWNEKVYDASLREGTLPAIQGRASGLQRSSAAMSTQEKAPGSGRSPTRP